MTTQHKPLFSPQQNGPIRCVSIGKCLVEMAPGTDAGTYAWVSLAIRLIPLGICDSYGLIG